MNRKRKSVIDRNEISKLCTFRLGGYDQKVLIEGRRETLPVVVTLHGGPGTPIPFSVGCRGLFPEFTDKFIMVYWDQLGCGINNHVIDEHFRIESFADMTADLLREIRRMFPGRKILLFATSWGSILSAKVLERAEGLADAAVVCGQFVKDVFLNGEVFSELERSGLPAKKLRAIKNIRSDYVEPKELQLISGSLRRYTNAYTNKSGKQAPMGRMVLGLLGSPDYRLKDFKAVVINGYLNNISLWREIMKVDLTETLAGIRVPYTILQGDTDIVTSTKTVQALVEKSGNPNLQCKVVANTGHMPGSDMMEKVFQELTEQAFCDIVDKTK